MKKVYRILSLLLCLCMATGAYAQKWTRGQLIEGMEDIVGKQEDQQGGELSGRRETLCRKSASDNWPSQFLHFCETRLKHRPHTFARTKTSERTHL